MPRCFTITFTHNNKAYTAVVAWLQHSVSVYIPDQSLHHIIPDGRFSYDAQQDLNIDSREPGPMKNLMLDVLAAIELQTQSQRADNV